MRKTIFSLVLALGFAAGLQAQPTEGMTAAQFAGFFKMPELKCGEKCRALCGLPSLYHRLPEGRHFVLRHLCTAQTASVIPGETKYEWAPDTCC